MENEICSLKFEEGPAGFPMLVAYAARDIPKKEFAGSLAAAASRSSKEFVGFNERTLVVGEVSIRELVSRAGNSFVEGDEAANVDPADFAIPAKRFVLCNGWQSWSFAGELYGRERPRRALAPRLNIFVDHPAEAELRALARRGPGRRANSMVSHFFTVLRVGAARLALVSLGSGSPSSGCPCACDSLPPVTFFVDSSTIRIAVFADGAAFREGDPVARIALLAAPDYFALKDNLAALFDAVSPNRFSALEFLKGADTVTSPAVTSPAVTSAAVTSPRQTTSIMGGYETWYNHYLNIDETMVKNDLAALGKTPNLLNSYFLSRGKPLVFQVDDGWERKIGDWRPNEKFPGGMAALASSIAQQGYLPGLWVAPFLTMLDTPVAIRHPDWLLRKSPDVHNTGHQGTVVRQSIKAGAQSANARPSAPDVTSAPDVASANVRPEDLVVAGWHPGWGGNFYCLDLGNPEVLDYLEGLFDTIINEWGFRYLKLDFLYAGMLTSWRGEAWKSYCNALQIITSIKTNRAGQPVAYLSCGAPFESTAPFMPLMRIGADTRESWEDIQGKRVRHQGRPSAKNNMTDTLGRSLLNQTVLLNDPDVVFCRTSNIALKDQEKFLIGLVSRMFGSQLMTSDEPGALTDGERQFTEELCDYYDKLEGQEFGVERLSAKWPDVYRFFSRGERTIDGVINLSDRSRLLTIESATTGLSARDGKTVLVPAHSILLFGLS